MDRLTPTVAASLGARMAGHTGETSEHDTRHHDADRTPGRASAGAAAPDKLKRSVRQNLIEARERVEVRERTDEPARSERSDEEPTRRRARRGARRARRAQHARRR